MRLQVILETYHKYEFPSLDNVQFEERRLSPSRPVTDPYGCVGMLYCDSSLSRLWRGQVRGECVLGICAHSRCYSPRRRE